MSFPNPGMLPLSEAGGALSGANFGVFYTVLMQVGYKHFAPRVLKQLNDGMPLFEALQLIQEELRPFNDRIINDAVDRLPTMFDITVEMLLKFGKEKTDIAKQNIGEGLGLGELFKGLLPSLPEAEARVGAGQADRFTGLLDSASKVKEKADADRLAAANKRIEDFKKQQQFEKTVIQPQKIPEVHQISTKEFKPKAGQTQMLQRDKLIRGIHSYSIQMKLLRHPTTGSVVPTHRGKYNAYLAKIKILEKQLTGLLGRYRWS